METRGKWGHTTKHPSAVTTLRLSGLSAASTTCRTVEDCLFVFLFGMAATAERGGMMAVAEAMCGDLSVMGFEGLRS